MGLKRLTACAVVMVSALVAVACSEPTPTGKLPETSAAASSSSATASPTSDATSTTSAAPTATYTPEEQAVIDQYKGYSDAFYSVPDLSEATVRAAFEPYVGPGVLDQIVAKLSGEMAGAGKRPSGEVVFGAITVSIAGNQASVTECRDTSTELIVSTVDGSILSQGKPGQKFETTLTFGTDHLWRVTYGKSTVSGC